MCARAAASGRLKDLADYRVIERKPLVGDYHGARIVSASPPSSGGVALLDALNILSGFDLQEVDSATRKHWSSRPCSAPTAIVRCIWAIRIS